MKKAPTHTISVGVFLLTLTIKIKAENFISFPPKKSHHHTVINLKALNIKLFRAVLKQF